MLGLPAAPGDRISTIGHGEKSCPQNTQCPPSIGSHNLNKAPQHSPEGGQGTLLCAHLHKSVLQRRQLSRFVPVIRISPPFHGFYGTLTPTKRWRQTPRRPTAATSETQESTDSNTAAEKGITAR